MDVDVDVEGEAGEEEEDVAEVSSDKDGADDEGREGEEAMVEGMVP